MELDLGEVLKGVEPFAAPAANDQSDFDHMLAVMTQMQEGINALTDVVIGQKAQIAALQVEMSRIKARTDAPPRALIKPGDGLNGYPPRRGK